MARRLSLLERIVDRHAGQIILGRVSVAMERAAEEFAREALADEEFRRTLHELVRRRCRAIMDRLLRENHK